MAAVLGVLCGYPTSSGPDLHKRCSEALSVFAIGLPTIYVNVLKQATLRTYVPMLLQAVESGQKSGSRRNLSGSTWWKCHDGRLPETSAAKACTQRAEKDVENTILRLRCASSASILREGLSCSLIETAMTAMRILPGIWYSN